MTRLKKLLRPPSEISNQLIMWMAIVAAVLSISASGVAGIAIVRVGNQAEQADRNSLITCERTRLQAPYLAKFYEEHRIFPPSVLKLYRSTVPKTCTP